ncbi:hypothetical protein CALCODRAFT_165828 [Calocera cornea HHB12733]|uniref:Uncharacterized protein n=1 Tax=Calocera cornea HHB12733 TaxID=1353952 RepID=A0A165HWQ0_9BASI|nr:hypothetical protein CALCODRAFT_165828 [Calocera cornea HHB12733]
MILTRCLCQYNRVAYHASYEQNMTGAVVRAVRKAHHTRSCGGNSGGPDRNTCHSSTRGNSEGRGWLENRPEIVTSRGPPPATGPGPLSLYTGGRRPVLGHFFIYRASVTLRPLRDLT